MKKLSKIISISIVIIISIIIIVINFNSKIFLGSDYRKYEENLIKTGQLKAQNSIFFNK